MVDIVRRWKRRTFQWLDRQLVYSRQHSWQAIVQSNAKLSAEASIENISGDARQINIGANSFVRGRLLIYGHGGSIKLGEWCYIGVRSEIWSMESVTIGDRVLIAHDVNINDGSAHSLDPMERHLHYQKIRTVGHPRTWDELPGIHAAPIVIEDDVWISFGVTILQGVTIGARSIIAAGSLVTANVPPDSIYRCKIEPIIQPIDIKNR